MIGKIIVAQISPGELTNAHKDLEGISNCTKCHELGEAVLNSKCLDCHSEIQNLINQERGYHSFATVKNKNCFDCHSEHHGRNFEILRFDEKKFSHDLTGFSLSGKHNKIDCKDCHNKKFIADEELKETAKYIGLESSCNTCHEDAHNNTLSQNCIDCHSFESFNPAENFSHENSQFKLTGKHKKVECEKCHETTHLKKINLKKFKLAKYNECGDCHADIHNNKFGNKCSSCHTTESFNKINNRNSFEHAKTNFPLLGKHKNVKCKDCHTVERGLKPKYNNCFDCHEDFHKGEFNSQTGKRDCAECHTEQGFESTKFSISDHNKIKFQLLGAHLAVPCNDCHYQNNKWKFRLNDIECIQCHSNIHENSISDKYYPNNNCESCHDFNSWNSVLFEHSKTGFELLGRHSKILCKDCHLVEKDNDEIIYVFKGLNKSCNNCHIDVHQNQFFENGEVRCFECHTNENWNPTKFDHDNSKFKLVGIHKRVKCVKCHDSITDSGQSYINYKTGKFECADCHS